MNIRILLLATLFALVTACSPSEPDPPPSRSSSVPSSPGASSPAGETAATVVRFTSGDTHVDVRIGPETPAIRDFLSMLPLTLAVEELSGREKIAYLPRKLDHRGTAGSDPKNGDLIYYK